MAHSPIRIVAVSSVAVGTVVALVAAAIAFAPHNQATTAPLVRAADVHTVTPTTAWPTRSRTQQAGTADLRAGVTDPDTVCSYRTTTIACHDPNLGWWNSTDSCYWNVVTPQPPADSLLWLGNLPANGDLYTRTCETQQGLGLGVLGTDVAFSSDAPPGYNGLAGVKDELLGLQAIVSLGLLPPSVHTAPSATGIGLVGMPVWMWQDSGLFTLGPLNLTIGVTLLGLSVGVGIKALGAQIDYYMGDGNDVVCHGLGTTYTATSGRSASPTCGYVYSQPSTTQPGGHYTVTAAATWNVSWTIGPDTGSITIVRATTVPITIDELQVVNQ